MLSVHTIRSTSLLISFSLLTACNSQNKQVLEAINNTSPQQQTELNKFIHHYDNSKDQQEVAMFLVANMINKYSVEGNNYKVYQAFLDSIEINSNTINSIKGSGYKISQQKQSDNHSVVNDLNIIRADSMILHLDASFQQWELTPWAKQYPNHIFKNYIVPYRVADEPLEYYWRKDAYSRYKHLLKEYKDSSLTVICSQIYQQLNYQTNNLFWGEPLQRYSDNMKHKRGTCSDHAVYTTMVMRALGIPTSIDFVPYWGDNNNGHSFNSLLLPDGTCKGYNNKEDLMNELSLSGKVPKIYRKVYEIQRNSLLYKHRNTEYIPDVFAQHDVVDVTENYNIPLTDVTITPKLCTPHSRIVYLTVFSPQKWRPVAWTEYKNKQIEFRQIGVGYTAHDSPSCKGENYGEGCLYLPVCYSNEEIQALTFPFILKEKESPRYLVPNQTETETIVLHRKYPRKKRIIGFANKMRGGYFELSNDCNFTQSDIVSYVDSLPVSRKQIIPLTNKKKYRYMRFYKRNGGFSIGEMGALNDQNQAIVGKVLADKALMDDSELNKICDNDVLSYFDIGNLKDLWVGLDFGQPTLINAIYFCPRTDDNDISPGNEYELFYWNNQWISLEKQVATSYQLIFNNIPRNTLLWLRNLTKGREERPFTYENKEQVWW